MSISRDVGKKIREIRDFRKISVEDLAERSKLNVELITQIEEKNNVPSLAPLIRIARVLGVRLGTFLDDAYVLGPVISRAENRKTGVSFSGQTSNQHTHMEFFPLAGDKSARHMEPFIIDIQGSNEPDYLLSTHEGEEFIYVLKGEVEIIYGQDTFTLNEGDSIYYDSVVEHNVHATPGQSAKILAVVYSPY